MELYSKYTKDRILSSIWASTHERSKYQYVSSYSSITHEVPYELPRNFLRRVETQLILIDSLLMIWWFYRRGLKAVRIKVDGARVDENSTVLDCKDHRLFRLLTRSTEASCLNLPWAVLKNRLAQRRKRMSRKTATESETDGPERHWRSWRTRQIWSTMFFILDIVVSLRKF